MSQPAEYVRPTAGVTAFYIGRPGSMQRMLVPDTAWSAPFSRGEVARQVLSGGTTTTRRRRLKRQYAFNFTGMSADAADQLMGFYSGSYGAGPYCLVDPNYRNHLSLDVSTMGVAVGGSSDWCTAEGSPVPYLDPSVAPPLVGTGVVRWPTPTNAQVLSSGGRQSGILLFPDLQYSPVWIADQTVVASIYIRTANNTALIDFNLNGLPAAGGSTYPRPTVAATNLTIGTAWQRISLLLPVGVSGFSGSATPYLDLGIRCKQNASPDILIAAADVQYGVSRAAPWVIGTGTPRVSISAGLGSTPDFVWRRNHTFAVSET